MQTMISRRCSMCAANWPDQDDYKKCPECGETTDRIRDITPMDDDEARSRKRHADFESFMEKWDETHDPNRLKGDAVDASCGRGLVVIKNS